MIKPKKACSFGNTCLWQVAKIKAMLTLAKTNLVFLISVILNVTLTIKATYLAHYAIKLIFNSI